MSSTGKGCIGNLLVCIYHKRPNGLKGFLVIQEPGALWLESRRDQSFCLYIFFLFFCPRVPCKHMEVGH